MTDETPASGGRSDDDRGRFHTPSTRHGPPRRPKAAGPEDIWRPGPPSEAPFSAAPSEAAKPQIDRVALEQARARARADAFTPEPLKWATAPVTIILLLIMGVLEGLLLLADSRMPGMRNQIYEMFAFTPLKTYASAVGAFGPEGFVGLFTHMLLHGGLLHYGLNAAVMAALGPAIERRLGMIGFALFFVAAGVGGGVGHGLWEYGVMLNNPEIGAHALLVQLVGASGAISGLLGAELYRRANVLRATPPELRHVSPARFLFNASAGFIVVNLALSLMGSFISGSAHLGGFVVGLAIAALIGLGNERRRLN